MEKLEFEQGIRKIAFLVIGFVAWGLVLLSLSYIITSSGIAYSLGFYSDLAILILLIIGVYFAISRIYTLVFALEESEET